ncbi:hypothetical protein AAMO2058_000140700 [Amorphochlora amoebiformis]|uniref:Thioredoxin domain-containing protein n=1 Tax=Amorphochlora amoebiformis TaxID=1561963 RepID=A0A7S0DSH3_9EUKA|mmetsp:Transcript_8322/g.13015  ORF Transcript_8322/g.13015 Transcript_8322/m.13015 type:complete len:414 (+) Transcript_8322:44-1285(+)
MAMRNAFLLSAAALAAYVLLSTSLVPSNSMVGGSWWKFGRNGPGSGGAGGATAGSHVVEVQSEEHFVSIIKSNATKDTVIVDFYGNNCPYCVQIAPFYEQLATELKDYATFLKINVQTQPRLAKGIEGLPTFLFICRGESLGVLPGADQNLLVQVTTEAIKKCTEAASQPKVELNELCPATEKFENNVNFYGGNIKEAVTRVPDKESCCGVCAIVPECKGFTYLPDGGQDGGLCYPKQSVTNKVKADPTLGYVSGQVSDAQREEVVAAINEKYAAGGGEQKGSATGRRSRINRPDPKADLPAATCQFESNVDYTGQDLSMGSLKRKDKQDCCNYCAANPDCGGFTFMEDPDGKDFGWCFMKSSNVGRREADPRMRLTSGVVITIQEGDDVGTGPSEASSAYADASRERMAMAV